MTTAMNSERISKILVFQIQDILFGIDGRQIRRVCSIQDVPEEVELYYFHEKVAFRKLMGAYRHPSVILPIEKALKVGIIVEQVADYFSIQQSRIMDLPKLFKSIEAMSLYKNVVSVDGKLIFIIDFEALIAAETSVRDMPLPDRINTLTELELKSRDTEKYL